MSRSSSEPRFPPPPVASPPQTLEFYPTMQQARAEQLFTEPPAFQRTPPLVDVHQPRKHKLAPAAEISFATGSLHAISAVSEPPSSDFSVFDPTNTSPNSLQASAESDSELDEPHSINSATDDSDVDIEFSGQPPTKGHHLAPDYSHQKQPFYSHPTAPYNAPHHGPKKMSPRVSVIEVHATFELEEITGDYDAVLSNMEHITILRPSSIEEFTEPEYMPSRSQPRRRRPPPERDVVDKMNNLNMGFDSDSDLEEPEVREFMRRQRELKRQTRLSHGSSIGKRPFSDRDDPDIEDLKSQYRDGTVFTEETYSDRRTRRRVGDRRLIIIADSQLDIPELEEPDTDDEVKTYDYALDCELPYHGFEVMVMDSDDDEEDDEEMERENDNGVPLYPQESL